MGHPPRWDARCLNCGSRERHRLLWLWVAQDRGNRLEGLRILHFAPEKIIMRQMRGNRLYETADLRLTVPVNTSRQQTYENPAATSPAERHAHFGAEDHVRYYGLDFADRLAEAGFAVSTLRQTPAEEVKYGLLRHEWLYVATKSNPT